jgi:hypothetical protein
LPAAVQTGSIDNEDAVRLQSNSGEVRSQFLGEEPVRGDASLLEKTCVSQRESPRADGGDPSGRFCGHGNGGNQRPGRRDDASIAADDQRIEVRLAKGRRFQARAHGGGDRSAFFGQHLNVIELLVRADVGEFKDRQGRKAHDRKAWCDDKTYLQHGKSL